jgi:hypothetical protein
LLAFRDRNERIINLDGLLVASEVIYELDELMNYVDVSARTPRISWAKPWRVSGTCAAPVFSMAQPRTPPSRWTASWRHGDRLDQHHRC